MMKTTYRRAAALAAILGLAGCALPLNPPVSGYLCCNASMQHEWVSSNNWIGHHTLPAGAPADITSGKKTYYFYGAIDGIDLSFRDDTGLGPDGAQRWIRQLVVTEDPTLRLAQWSPEVQRAVRASKVMRGMTREQVLMSLGYPPANETRDLNAPIWHYWTFQDEPIDMHFGADGRLENIKARDGVVRRFEYRPEAG